MISKIFSTLTYEYYLSKPTTKLNYIDNIVNYLPIDIIKKFESYDWASIPNRNFDSIKNLVDKNIDTKFIELSHFTKFIINDNCQWKITNYVSIFDNDKFLEHCNQMFKTYKVWVTQIQPGCCIPNHIDTVDEFITSNNIDVSDIHKIKRYLILPESIKPWHHLWYGNTILSEGAAGDMYEFDFWLAHGGGNLGPTNKYTIQIMAI